MNIESNGPVTGTVNVAGVELHNLSRAELLQRLNVGVFFNPNVDVIMKLRRDPEFFALFHQAEFRICDSRIVELGARFLGTPVKEKISGSDFFGQFCHYHRANPDVRVFLLGAGPGVAQQARERINDREGREIIVAAHSPTLCIVALGSPKSTTGQSLIRNLPSDVPPLVDSSGGSPVSSVIASTIRS